MTQKKRVIFKNKLPKEVATEILSEKVSPEDIAKSIEVLNKEPLGLMFLSEVEFYVNKMLADKNISAQLPLQELEKTALFSLPLYLSSYLYVAIKDLKAKDVSWEWEKYHIEFFESVLAKIGVDNKEKYEEQYNQLFDNLKILPGATYADKKLYAASYTTKRMLSVARLIQTYHQDNVLDFISSHDWDRQTLSKNIEARKAFWIFKTLFLSNNSISSYAHMDKMWDNTVLPALKETVRPEDFLALDYILKRLNTSKENYWNNLICALPKRVSLFLSEHPYEKTLMEQQFLKENMPQTLESVAFRHKI